LPHDLELLMSAAVYAVTFDCGNAATLARFWSGVLERSIDPDASEEFASIGLQDAGAARPGLMFNKVPEGKAAKNRVHLDLVAATLETEVERLLALGPTASATSTRVVPAGSPWPTRKATSSTSSPSRHDRGAWRQCWSASAQL
jgi:Glyoxalase-like domain